MGNTTDLSHEVAATRGNLIIAFTTLTTTVNAFAAVSEKVEQRCKELESREVNLKALEEKIAKVSLELEKREINCQERELKVTQREKDVEEKVSKWMETEKRMATNASKLPTLIHMNIGGVRFTAPKASLLQYKGSYFEAMLLTDHSQQQDNGELFIDRDPELCKYLLEFIRTGQIKPNIKFETLRRLEPEFTFFNLPGYLLFGYISVLSTWLPNTHFKLIYKATRDGFKGKDFHKACDNKGPTLTIIQSNHNFLFGGYSSGPWDSSGTFKNYPESFIFTLTNPHSIPPSKYHLAPLDEHATQCAGGYGPTFGGGQDIFVCSESHQTNSSFTNFPVSYQDISGKGMETFTGSYYFTSKEVEVYSAFNNEG